MSDDPATTTVEKLHAKHGDVTHLRPNVAQDELHELALFLQDHGWAGIMCLREAVEAFGESPDSLDAAWAEAKAALPPGHTMDLTLEDHVDGGRFLAWTMRHTDSAILRGEGPTPAAALRALAAKLREG